jgi:hypothetical protein
MDLGAPGVLRGASPTHITPSNTALRVYSVHITATNTPTDLVLANNNGTATSTATPWDARIIVPIDNITNSRFTGNFDCSYGVRFENGVYLQTSGSLSFYTIVYSTEV